jgi:hypothetical protein
MKKSKNEKGQSTIEFILTFSVTLSFVFLFLKMALTYTNGYMVHFATFMASRSYLVNDSEQYNSIEDGDPPAFILAKKVYKKYLPEGLISNFNGALKENNPSNLRNTVFTGVYSDFTQSISAGMFGGGEPIELRSESFLGREPTRKESYSQTCIAIMSVTGGGCATHATLDDNGG